MRCMARGLELFGSQLECQTRLLAGDFTELGSEVTESQIFNSDLDSDAWTFMHQTVNVCSLEWKMF